MTNPNNFPSPAQLIQAGRGTQQLTFYLTINMSDYIELSQWESYDYRGEYTVTFANVINWLTYWELKVQKLMSESSPLLEWFDSQEYRVWTFMKALEKMGVQRVEFNYSPDSPSQPDSILRPLS